MEPKWFYHGILQQPSLARSRRGLFSCCTRITHTSRCSAFQNILAFRRQSFSCPSIIGCFAVVFGDVLLFHTTLQPVSIVVSDIFLLSVYIDLWCFLFFCCLNYFNRCSRKRRVQLIINYASVLPLAFSMNVQIGYEVKLGMPILNVKYVCYIYWTERFGEIISGLSQKQFTFRSAKDDAACTDWLSFLVCIFQYWGRSTF